MCARLFNYIILVVYKNLTVFSTKKVTSFTYTYNDKRGWCQNSHDLKLTPPLFPSYVFVYLFGYLKEGSRWCHLEYVGRTIESYPHCLEYFEKRNALNISKKGDYNLKTKSHIWRVYPF